MMFPSVITATTLEETFRVAEEFAKELTGGEVVALVGDLGAGKTTFSQGVAQALGILTRILSPTFVVMRSYPIPGDKDLILHHLDLYRMESEADIRALDIHELLADPKAITLIEWPEKVAEAMLAFTHQVKFEVDGDVRHIRISTL
jgi:tRNA threonylcarbamoyladenosine biosynthesis protein TsaE